MQIEADPELLDALFPAHIVADAKLIVTGFGRSIARRFPSIRFGDDLAAHFTIRDSDAGTPITVLAKGMHLGLEHLASGAKLSGYALPCEQGFVLTLRHVTDNYLLENTNLEISDFARDDPAVHGLLLSSIQRAMLEEQRLVTLELAMERQKSVDLLDRVSRISGFIAHDFNNLISIIRLNCERLMREAGMDARQLRLLGIMKSTATRGSAVTRSMMALSQQRYDIRGLVSIDELITDNLPFFAAIVGTAIELDTELGAADLRIEASPVVALNNLINLLFNARDAMPDGGRISIRTRRRPAPRTAGHDSPGAAGEGIAIEVADTGAGMEQAVLSRAFEPLFSTKANGTGLGLASVLDFARDAGGEAWIDSAPGAGTRVCLYLPCRNVAAVPVRQSGAAVVGGTHALTTKCMRDLLIVDDEPYALEALAELLEAEGYRVATCGSAQQARAELAARPVHVLITDIVMPGESGVNLARQARTQHPGLKTVLMSGYVPDDEDLGDEVLFIRKPIDSKVLIEMLRSMFSISDNQVA